MIQNRYYQSEAAQYTYDHIVKLEGQTNPLIALPTGTGKSIVIVLLIMKLIAAYWQCRVMVITHSKDLVKQNRAKFASIAGHIPSGINCDGLGKRDWMQPVIFGSIKSVLPMLDVLGFRDVLIIDEAHRASEDKKSEYAILIEGLKKTNPNLIVIGLTATPYDNYGDMIRRDPKTKQLTSLFDSYSYSRIKPEDFKEFVDNGWLCRLITKGTETKYDVSKVKIVAGQYNQKQLQEATDKQSLTEAAVSETIYIANMDQRHCGMVFANGIDHAEHIAEEFLAQGENAVYVHSKRSAKENKRAMDEFHEGGARWMVNNGILTTGYDFPPIDIGAIIRHCTSAPLLHQILGRFTRPYDCNNPHQYVPGFDYVKHNSLILDFAGNTARLGPIDAPYFKKPKTGEIGDAPVKECQYRSAPNQPKCGVINYASARVCYMCFNEFTFEVKYEATAGHDAPMSLGEDKIEWKNVTYVNYQFIGGDNGKPKMLQVVYHSGSKTYKHVVCIEHKNGAYRYAVEWWNAHTDNVPMPSTVDDALRVTHLIRKPTKIEITTTPGVKYPKVTNYVY